MFAPVLLLLALAGSVRTDTAMLQFLDKFDPSTLLETSLYTMENTQCKEDLDLYFANITSSPWAVQMFDSTAKSPEGLLQGNTNFMGQYDECVGVQSESINFTGKHCLSVILPVPSDGGGGNGQPAVLSAPGVLPVAFRYGMCVPSSCSGPDIADAINSKLAAVGFMLDIPETSCSTSEPLSLRAEDWVVIELLIIVGVIVLASTVYDVNQQLNYKNAKPHKVLSAFSLYSNLTTLFSISSSGQMGCLHGLRSISMMWVVFSHAHMIKMYFPNVNAIKAMDYMYNVEYDLISNGFLSVDTFFFLSGLLVCFVFFRDIGRNKTYDAPMGYIHRYLRLTPPYAMMILLQITILMVVGNGPFWYTSTVPMADTCKRNWWSGLLYIQNFVEPMALCLGQSWYLNADMQMYWISPLLLYPLYLFPIGGAVWLGLVLLGSLSTNFAVAYVNGFGPSTVISNVPEEQQIDYFHSYMRLTPWLIGVGLGYIICGIKAKKIEVKLSKLTVLAGWIFSTGACLGSIYGLNFFQENADYTSVQASFYYSFHRLGWGLGLAWIVFACLHGYGGPVNVFLSWSVFQPLGKLSYCTYLIHSSIQSYRAGMLRVNTYVSELDFMYEFLGDLVLSTLLSIPFTCIFEMPFVQIERYLLRDVVIFSYPKKEEVPAKTEDLEVGVDNPQVKKD